MLERLEKPGERVMVRMDRQAAVVFLESLRAAPRCDEASVQGPPQPLL